MKSLFLICVPVIILVWWMLRRPKPYTRAQMENTGLTWKTNQPGFGVKG